MLFSAVLMEKNDFLVIATQQVATFEARGSSSELRARE
jgi:hypothetical protein